MTNRKLAILFREAVAAITETIISVICWTLFFPLSLLVKRDSKLTLVISRKGFFFADNSKYFFVYAHEELKSDEKIIFLTSDRMLRDMIQKAGAEAVLHPSAGSLLLLLKCGTLVTDVVFSNFAPLIRGAKFVQIWHGAPLKHIELDLHNRRISNSPLPVKTALNMQKHIIGRYPVYDIVVSTSHKFIEHAFQSAFRAGRFASTGYPRNDIFFGWPEKNTTAYRLSRLNVDIGAIQQVQNAKSGGKIICLYAPTYRKNMTSPFDSVIDLNNLSDFAGRHNILIVLKLHPVVQGRRAFHECPNILAYDSLGDVYPLMPLCDILITDYSSIYFDYLLLGKPIVFFPYDLESYLEEDSNMYFNYGEMTPGPKCRTQKELENELKKIVSEEGADEYAAIRGRISTFTHDYQDNLSYRRLIEGFLHNR
jgi:CDP-glycerol glycerophosphotransferase